jgi:proteasome lid subunit RPN8/RPN11
MFKPHKFETMVVGVPTIYIPLRVLNDMWALTNLVTTEIGWMMTAKYENENIILGDVLLPKQQVHGATTEFDPGDQAAIYEKMMREDLANGVKPEDMRVNDVRAWFHSHCEMETSPSGQDDTQANQFHTVHGWPWLLRGIVNKKGKIRLDLFLFEEGFLIKDVDWEPLVEKQDDVVEKWRSVVIEKVSALSYAQPPAGKYNMTTAGQTRIEGL